MKWSSILQGILIAFAADVGALPVAMWVHRQELRICKRGEPLTEDEVKVARLVGVQFPERVRILGVEEVPFPCDWLARQLASLTGRFPSRALGLAAGYGIYIQSQSRWSVELVVHELVHTAQYERMNGILGFLRNYLRDCLRNGYINAEMECEARDLSVRALRHREADA